MTDIETLGTGPDACVLSVGIVAFSQDEGIIASNGWAIREHDWHGRIDPSTVKWWMQQNAAAQEYSFKGTFNDLQVAHEFAGFLKQWGGDEAWANDPDFDITILKGWWKRVEENNKVKLGPFPIRYTGCRSQRTIQAEATRLGIPYDHVFGSSTVAHNPVDDAANQARRVIFIRNHITAAQP
jgi:hypothetical protein